MHFRRWTQPAFAALALTCSLLASAPAGAAVQEQKHILASNALANDHFGVAISLSGDTLAVGANTRAASIGAVYVYERDFGGNNNWGERKIIVPTGVNAAVAGDSFGAAVVLDGDTLAVGAPGRDSGKGAVYIFKRNEATANNWGEVKILTASDAVAGDAFGATIALSGNTLVVGAAEKSTDAGAAYVFDRSNAGTDDWTQTLRLSPSVTAAGNAFGKSVGISGNLAIVGAEGENTQSGAAYIFRRDKGGANNWGEAIRLVAIDAAANNFFGNSVAISDASAVVGAYGRNSNSGAVYIFERTGSTDAWTNPSRATGNTGSRLGQPVAMDTNLIVAGAIAIDSGSGGAQVFERVSGSWVVAEGLLAALRGAGDAFGAGVSLFGGAFAIGAPNRDSSRGAAYIFEEPPQAQLDGGAIDPRLLALLLTALLLRAARQRVQQRASQAFRRG